MHTIHEGRESRADEPIPVMTRSAPYIEYAAQSHRLRDEASVCERTSTDASMIVMCANGRAGESHEAAGRFVLGSFQKKLNGHRSPRGLNEPVLAKLTRTMLDYEAFLARRMKRSAAPVDTSDSTDTSSASAPSSPQPTCGSRGPPPGWAAVYVDADGVHCVASGGHHCVVYVLADSAESPYATLTLADHSVHIEAEALGESACIVLASESIARAMDVYTVRHVAVCFSSNAEACGTELIRMAENSGTVAVLHWRRRQKTTSTHALHSACDASHQQQPPSSPLRSVNKTQRFAKGRTSVHRRQLFAD